MVTGKVKFIGIDISTTAVSGVGYTDKGEIISASVPMRGATTWRNQPAHTLYALTKNPLDEGMLYEIISLLEQQSNGLSPDGAICFSVRQHDMVLTDDEFHLLAPALSWQCNWANQEVKELKENGIENDVGMIEPRFILPKLLKTIREDIEDRDGPNITYFLSHVMTTGDWVNLMLTGRAALSTSDALSNGLLYQKNKRLAIRVIRAAGLSPIWFPPVVQSGTIVGRVRESEDPAWEKLCKKLHSWLVIAGLGDNHAGAVGCGLSDFGTIVVSAGSSGTAVRLAFNNAQTFGEAVSFEFFNYRMLLTMLADCATRYDQFVRKYGENKTHKELDELVESISGSQFASKIINVQKAIKNGKSEEEAVAELSLSEKITYIQYDITKKLGDIVYILADEVLYQKYNLKKIVLTGGLTKSGFFCKCLAEYLCFLNLPVYKLVGIASSKAAAYGALITAMVGSGYFPNLKAATKTMCMLKPV